MYLTSRARTLCYRLLPILARCWYLSTLSYLLPHLLLYSTASPLPRCNHGRIASPWDLSSYSRYLTCTYCTYRTSYPLYLSVHPPCHLWPLPPAALHTEGACCSHQKRRRGSSLESPSLVPHLPYSTLYIPYIPDLPYATSLSPGRSGGGWPTV